MLWRPQSRDWHGFTKQRRPVAILGTARQAPAISWNTKMLPDQRRWVFELWFIQRSRNLVRHTLDARRAFATAKGQGRQTVSGLELAVPFWSRESSANARRVDVARAIEQAELHLWLGRRRRGQRLFQIERPSAEDCRRWETISFTASCNSTRPLERGTNG